MAAAEAQHDRPLRMLVLVASRDIEDEEVPVAACNRAGRYCMLLPGVWTSRGPWRTGFSPPASKKPERALSQTGRLVRNPRASCRVIAGTAG
eukprot:scaffold6016_cov119-Isochrysis_galbana.AAC.10